MKKINLSLSRTRQGLLLALGALLLTAAPSCKKDEDKSPSKTALLTAHDWKDGKTSLVINSIEGTHMAPASEVSTYKFGTDGKVTSTDASGKASISTWMLSSDEKQITVTMPPNPAITQDIYTLTPTELSVGLTFTQAQIQAQLSGQTVPGVPDGLIVLLLLSSGNYTFPTGAVLPSDPKQITSLQFKTTLVPK